MNLGEPEWCGKLYVFGLCVLDFVHADCDNSKHLWNDKIPKYVRLFVSFEWYITVTVGSEYRTCTGNIENRNML